MAEIYAPVGGGAAKSEPEGVQRATREDRAPTGFGGPVVSTLGTRFPFNVVDAKRAGPVAFSVTTNAKTMGAELTADMVKLLAHCGLQREMPEVQYAFFQALGVAHTMNSGSTRVPNRATFNIAGHEGPPWNWSTDVVGVLMESTRRFFRGMADETVLANKALLKKRGTGTQEELEMIGVIDAVALDRGLVQYPWLAFDGADGCTSESTTLPERMAIRASKAVIAPRAEDFIGNQYRVQKELTDVRTHAAPEVGGYTV